MNNETAKWLTKKEIEVERSRQAWLAEVAEEVYFSYIGFSFHEEDVHEVMSDYLLCHSDMETIMTHIKEDYSARVCKFCEFLTDDTDFCTNCGSFNLEIEE